MRDKLLKYADSEGFDVQKRDSSAIIGCSVKPHYELQITVPYIVDEWFLSLRDAESNLELFRTWDEHYNLRGEEPRDLDEELQESVIKTLDTLRNAEVRIVQSPGISILGREFFKGTVLEVSTDSGWIDFWELVYPEE